MVTPDFEADIQEILKQKRKEWMRSHPKAEEVSIPDLTPKNGFLAIIRENGYMVVDADLYYKLSKRKQDKLLKGCIKCQALLSN